jgi:hypothetical protein
MDLHELPGRGGAGPQFIDVLVAVLEYIFDLAPMTIIEAIDGKLVFLELSLLVTLFLRFWLRLLIARSRYRSPSGLSIAVSFISKIIFLIKWRLIKHTVEGAHLNLISL